MPQLDKFLAYAESHRLLVCAFAGVVLVGVVWLDWTLPNISVGFLYLIPVLLCAAALNGAQIIVLAVVCAYLREAFDPLQAAVNSTWLGLPVTLNALHWPPGAGGRLIVISVG